MVRIQQNPLGARILATGGVRAWAAGSGPQGGRCAAALFMSFLRHEEMYPFDEGVITRNPPRSSNGWVSGWLFLGRLHSGRACLRFTSRRVACRTTPSRYNRIPANGELYLNCLSQPRGSPQQVAQEEPEARISAAVLTRNWGGSHTWRNKRVAVGITVSLYLHTDQ
jgi:hypothetical protein